MNENWSIQLLVGDGDVAGYNQFELVYNQSSNTKYKLTQNTASITGQQPIILNHTSDDNAPIPARSVEANKMGRFQISVYDDDNTPATWDTILENIHTLNRHISGADSTAVRHSIDGTAQRVRVAITPDGASLTTYFEVLHGYADVSRSYYQAESQQGDDSVAPIGALFIPLNLTFKPGGEGDTITLNNRLASSPGMIEDSNADGFADNLSAANTAPTNKTIATDRGLTGEKCQFFRVDATNTSGIKTGTVTAALDTDAVAYAWVQASLSTADILTIELQDGSAAVIDDIDFDPSAPAGYDKTAIDFGGTTWYRYVVSGTNTTGLFAANFVLVIRRKSANATVISNYYVDNIYLQTGTLTAPEAWCSTTALKNRYDTSVAESNINYLDVWGIPGDLPAIAKQVISTYPREYLLVSGRYGTGANSPSDAAHWIESDDFNIVATAWSSVVDGTRSGGEYITALSTSGSGSTRYVVPNDLVYMFNQPLRMFVLMRVDNANANLKVRFYSDEISTSGDLYYETGEITPAAPNVWSLVDFGLVNIGNQIPKASEATRKLQIYLTHGGTAGNINVDGLFLLPTQSYFLSSNKNPFANIRILDGINNQYSLSASSNSDISAPYAGNFPVFLPGIENRLIYIHYEDDESYTLADAPEITLTVTPRTSHLLGVA